MPQTHAAGSNREVEAGAEPILSDSIIMGEGTQ